MALYDVVNGIYRKVGKKYDPVEGIYRNVKAAYDPVGGVYRKYFAGGLTAGELAVGDSVWLTVDGNLTEFLVIHQGNPDSEMYDISCDGTWVLMKDIYTKSVRWDSTDNDYKNATVHSFLKNTLPGRLDANAQAAIKQVKIPYWNGTGKGGSLAIGSEGLSTKGFLLSKNEINAIPTTNASSFASGEGSALDYFSGMNTGKDAGRIAYFDGAVDWWCLRTVHTGGTTNAFRVVSDGSCDNYQCTSSLPGNAGVRPAFILDNNTRFDPTTKTIIE